MNAYVKDYAAGIWQARYFWTHLALSDLRSRWRRSFFGALWSIIQPLGMTLLSGLRPAEGGSSEYQGEIYNRENAKTYRVNLTPAEPEQLLVHAYVGIPLFGKTQVWRRPAAEQGSGQ